MSEYLTRAELEARYDGEWVVLADPTENEQSEVTGGHLIAHGLDADEVARAALPLRGKVRSFAFLCFAKEPEGMEYIL
jgi:hypothetical protein